MNDRPVLIVILAAGKGTRMKSDVPKVLHTVAGLSMLGHVLALGQTFEDASLAVVVGPGMDNVCEEVNRLAPQASVFTQHQQRGTADAVLAAQPALENFKGDVIVLYADTPLVTRQTLHNMRQKLAGGAGIVVLGFEPDDVTGYGRLLTSAKGELTEIREDKDATEKERQVRLCNSGVMAFAMPDIVTLLRSITPNNAKGEFYLTDAVALARQRGARAEVVIGDADEVLGVNARDQLAAAEFIWQKRRRKALMQAGVTMIAPETVWLSHDTEIGRDCVIEPNVFFGSGVVVEEGVTIKANTHLEGFDRKAKTGVRIGKGSQIGPFARLRPGASLGTQVHIGNFVEVKNANMSDGAKANHLAYIGDASIGNEANIGAGTIFCNYDGFNKNHSNIGSGVFIGSNSAIVAPVTVGAGAFVAAGSVITNDVSSDALAIERSKQIEHEGWAAKFRTMMQRRRPKPD